MESRRVLIAPDSFKGTFRAAQVAAAIGRGIERAGMIADLCPLADGGEGTLEALLLALGGETVGATVTDPLGRWHETQFALVEGGSTAVLEMADASGLGLVDPRERNAWTASTYGTGELIGAAIDTGARVVLVGVGGSATTNGGAGALAAIEARGGLRGAKIVVLCDVRTPFELAPSIFGPQKGADRALVARLETRLDELAQTLPRDPRGVPMTGAAGGLAGGLWAVHGAALKPGAAFILQALNFDRRLADAAAVVTGEGKLDDQTLQGKLIGELAARATRSGTPVHAIVGTDSLGSRASEIGLQNVRCATDLEELEVAGLSLGNEISL